MIVMHATLPIDAETRDDALDLVTSLARESRTEDGVVDYRVTTDIEEPNTIRVIEQYADADAVDAHMSSEHFEAFQHDVQQHLVGAPELYRFEVDEKTQVM